MLRKTHERLRALPEDFFLKLGRQTAFPDESAHALFTERKRVVRPEDDAVFSQDLDEEKERSLVEDSEGSSW
jgi:hypothetical protein